MRHTFTHFHLVLSVLAAELPDDTVPVRGQFVDKHNFRPYDLPTVMRKAFNLVR